MAWLALAVGLGLHASADDRADREFQECRNCPIMVGIPGGSFIMGSPAREAGRFQNEGPQHRVTVKPFALGKFDVTSEQFQTFLTESRYQPQPCNPILDERWRTPAGQLAHPPYDTMPRKWPAVCLDWKDAQAFIAWLNAKVRRERPAVRNATGPYRLPSEAEWEYAARAGTATARWWGDEIGTGNANCNGCGSTFDDRELSDIDSFAPNPFGLYGVLGNAWQWTADCWHPSYAGAPADGRPWTEHDCVKHVVRGGSWDNVPVFVRSAARSGSIPDGSEYDYSSLSGFRVARDLP
jgi:formylglycine-generating enzyme required for sulfatase activity